MNKYNNTSSVIKLGDPSWSGAAQYNLINLKVKYIGDNKLETDSGHQFVNMCSFSYLGLDRHPVILESAIAEMKKIGIVDLPTARLRIEPQGLAEVEEQLSNLFAAQIITGSSCSSISQGVLPVIACGELTDKKAPLMIFDKNCHFSMNINKAICGDETEVITCEHNDINFIEDMCKKHPVVAYVADSAYSMGGNAPIKELLALQEKYGLFLYLDDSHSVSAYGEKGRGFARSQMNKISDRTIIVASLWKGFGACGGIAMLGSNKYMDAIKRFGGGLAWSQPINSAAIGAIKGSIKIHQSPELSKLQEQLRARIAYFDSLIKTPFEKNHLPIRMILMNKPEQALRCSKKIFDRGFYASAVFFPIIKKNMGGVRIMLRADLSEKEIASFCEITQQVFAEESVEMKNE